MHKNVLKDHEAAEYLGVSVSFLKKTRIEGRRQNHTPGSPYVKFGRSVRYLVADLDEWLQQHRFTINGQEE